MVTTTGSRSEKMLQDVERHYRQGATMQQAVRVVLDVAENERCMNCQSYHKGVCDKNGKRMNPKYSACQYFKSKKEVQNHA